MNLKRTIQKLDVLKLIPEEFKESSVLGLVLSVGFVVLAVILIFNQVVLLTSSKIESEILIDHQKDDKDLNVNIELIMHNYPCALVCLDKLDSVHTHTMDVQENLVKYSTNSREQVLKQMTNNDALNIDQRVELAKQQIANNEGCLLSGNFTIKMVPGNFHISFHKYGMELQVLMSRDGYRPDFSHTIRRLSFGSEDIISEKRVTYDFGLDTVQSLEWTDEKNLMQKVGFPHGVLHQLNIVPSKFEYPTGAKHEVYQYSASTFTIAGGMLSITFQFNIENVLMYYKMKAGSFSHFLIQCATILGGTYMLMSILKLLIEDGVLNMIYKRRLGKLE
jgi:hypothetical protein